MNQDKTSRLSFRNILKLISFEPDKEAYELILKEAEVNRNIYSYALSDGKNYLSIQPKRGELEITDVIQ